MLKTDLAGPVRLSGTCSGGPVLVSGRRAGWRRVYRPADDERPRMRSTACSPRCGSISAITAFRPWPWILVALVALVHVPQPGSHGNKGDGFVLIIRDHLPSGLRGLADCSLFRGLHVNDSNPAQPGHKLPDQRFLCKRFMAKEARSTNTTYKASRVTTVIMMVIALVITMPA